MSKNHKKTLSKKDKAFVLQIIINIFKQINTAWKKLMIQIRNKLLWFLLQRQFPALGLDQPQQQSVALMTMHQILDESGKLVHQTLRPDNTSRVVVLYRDCNEFLTGLKLD